MTMSTPSDGRLDGPTPAQVLACPMRDNDADASTIREYLIALLAVVWDEGEGFSGKRPFGNSSWEYDLYAALVKAGWISIVYDESGYYVREFEDAERRKANRLIAEAIQSLATTEVAA
jgi:hypothetical protein